MAWLRTHTWPFVNVAESTQAHIGHQQDEEEKVFFVTIKMIMIALMTRSYISKTVLLDASNDNRSVASHREAIALVLSIYWFDCFSFLKLFLIFTSFFLSCIVRGAVQWCFAEKTATGPSPRNKSFT